MTKRTSSAGLTSLWRRQPTEAETRNDESRGGSTELVCLNRVHDNPVSYTVKQGDPNTCPGCGRGN